MSPGITRPFPRFALFIAAALALSACSSGKSHTALPGDDTTFTAQVTIGEPATGITQLLTPVAVGKPDEPIAYSVSASHPESVIFALDKDGHLRLAAFLSQAQVTLDAESTATALVRLLLDQPQGTPTGQQLVTLIRGTPRYSNLKAAIAKAALAGTPPMYDSVVVLELGEVIHGVAQAIAGRQGNSANQISGPTVTTELPFDLVPDVLSGQLPVQITGTCSEVSCTGKYQTAQDVGITNKMPLAWSVVPRDPATHASLLGNDEEILLDANPIWRATGSVVGIPGLDRTTGIKGADGKSFLLEIRQSPASLAKAYTDVASSAISIVLGAVPNTCDITILEPVLNAAAKRAISQHQGVLNEDAVKTTFDEFLKFSFAADALQTCAPGRIQDVVKAIIDLPETSALGKAAYHGSRLAVQYAFLHSFASRPSVSFGVCIDGNGKIANCAKRFEFSPTVIAWVAPGVSVRELTTLSAFDNNDNATGIPSGLEWETDSEPALSANKETGSIVAKSEVLGARVTVRDPRTEAQGHLTVNVHDPVLCPNPLVVQVGFNQSRKIYLTNGTSANCNGSPVLQAPKTTWTIGNPGVAGVPLSVLTSCPEPVGDTTIKGSCAVITGLATGTTTLTVRNGVTGKETVATIVVEPAKEACDQLPAPGTPTECKFKVEPEKLALLTGQTAKLGIYGYTPDGSRSGPLPVKLEWWNPNADVATIDPDGTVHAVWEGKVELKPLSVIDLGISTISVDDAIWLPTRFAGTFEAAGTYTVLEPLQNPQEVPIKDQGSFQGLLQPGKANRVFRTMTLSNVTASSPLLGTISPSPIFTTPLAWELPLYGYQDSFPLQVFINTNGGGIFSCDFQIDRSWASTPDYRVKGKATLQNFLVAGKYGSHLEGTCQVTMDK
jgi:hypothetical protein